MTPPTLYLLDPDDREPEWAPFAGARPLAELRAGALRIADRWQRAVGAGAVAVVSPATPGFADAESLPIVSVRDIVGPAVVARSTALPLPDQPLLPLHRRGFALDGRTIAWVVPSGERWIGPAELTDALEVRGIALTGTVSLLDALERLLEADCAAFASRANADVPAGAVVIGDSAGLMVRGAAIEPQVIFDTRRGPIVIEAGAVVRAGARLEGPLYVGPHTWILGGALRHSAIGPRCRVHGEVARVVFLGYANKSHDGFLGDSVVGQWVNLGAGTITSNLKNTYGPIRIPLPEGRLDTGRINLGTLFGDHVKTAIGTLLGTGTVLGTGANVFGAATPPRFVPPFAWGPDEAARLDAEAFVTVARRVMPRRGVQVTAAIEASLRAIHARLCG